MVNFIRGNFLIFTMSMLFMFSTAYTIIFYWNQANNQAGQQSPGLQELGETTNQAQTSNSILNSITSGFIDDLLGYLSLTNFFGLFILLLKYYVPSDIFTFIDLLLLRPIGWVGTIITSNYVISKIRGTEE